MNMPLKNLREKLRLSQQQIAKELNITQSRYGNYESGCRKMPPEIANDLIDFAKTKKIKIKLEHFYPRDK